MFKGSSSKTRLASLMLLLVMTGSLVFIPKSTKAITIEFNDYPSNGGTRGAGVLNPISLGTSCSSLDNLGGIASCFLAVLGIMIQFIISLGMIYTIYGAIRFIGADGVQRTEWRNVIFRGLIALAIMFAIWGIVRIFTLTFFGGGTPTQGTQIPSLNSLVQ